ncbi:MAG: large-conductance mechanosensitive channel protein MscL [Janthinobacterium lividum]
MALPLTAGRIRAPGLLSEFRAFIMRGNVVDLAVGIIIGAAFTAIVQSLVKDIFTPLIGLLVGGIDFSNIFVVLKGAPAATLAEAVQKGDVTLNIGVFLNAVISFLIVAAAVFGVVKLLSTMQRREEAAETLPPTTTEALLMEIRDELRNGARTTA